MIVRLYIISSMTGLSSQGRIDRFFTNGRLGAAFNFPHSPPGCHPSETAPFPGILVTDKKTALCGI